MPIRQPKLSENGFLSPACYSCTINAEGQLKASTPLAFSGLNRTINIQAVSSGLPGIPQLLTNSKEHDALQLIALPEFKWEISPYILPLKSPYNWQLPERKVAAHEVAFTTNRQVICETDKKFKDIADAVPAMVWISDEENRIVYVNKSWIHFTGVNLAASFSTGWKDLVHPGDFLDNKEIFDQHFQFHLPITVTYRLKKGNGAYCWVQDKAVPRVDESGRFLGYIGSVIDINEQKIKEQQLRFQATILENVSDIIVIADLHFNILSANKIAETFYGIKPEDYLGKPFSDVVELKHNSLTRQQVRKHFEENGFWKGEVCYTHQSGAVKHLLFTINYVYDEAGNRVSIMGVGKNITERKIAEEKLRKSEQFYRNLIADSLDGILISDMEGKITFVSPSITHILGYNTEEVIHKNLFQFVHPQDFGAATTAFKNEVAAKAELKYIIIRLLNKKGEWVWCMVRGHNLMHNSNVGGVVIYFHDDTSRKKANEALQESEARFRTLIRDLHLGVVLLDTDGKITLSNKAISTTLNIEEEKLIGQNIASMVSNAIGEDGRPLMPRQMPVIKAVTTKKPVNNVVMGVICRNKKERVWLLVNTEPVLDSSGNITHIICSVNDITERKKLEQKLLTESINQQRLLTQATIDGQEKERKEIGKELHDNIGQQLTTTKLFLDLAKATADDSTNEMISLALKGISDVINEVRRMSRALVPPTLGDLGLIESINDLIDSISRAQYLKIDFYSSDINEDAISDNKKLMLFRIIQEQLNNIVKHADARQVTVALSENDNGLWLEVKDDGKGFDLKTVRRGLGLTNIQNRAALFGGTVDIIAAPGKGCMLTVNIPVETQEVVTAVK